MKCPICESISRKLIYEGENFSLYQCRNCKSNYIVSKNKINYEEEYFTDKYEKTYGKNYKEDEENLRVISRRRLKIIKSYFSEEEKPKLLDVGCAFGFFCDEANKLGFTSKGVEISSYARNVAISTYNIECYNNLFEISESFDCITLWYTLEHMEDPLSVLDFIKGKLKRKGILALGLPNGNGAFFRFNRREYLKKRPNEHIFEPSIKGIKLALRRKGFEVKKICIYGIHPERINLPNISLIRFLQKISRLGDTFEVYATRLE